MSFRREDIRYGNLWVRLVCCMAVAMAMANAIHFDILDAWEAVAGDLLIEVGSGHFIRATPLMEMLIVFCICFASAIWRIDRPLAMVGCALVFAAFYVLLVPGMALITPLALPVVSPVLALLGCTVFMETMAWSEERSRRTRLEQLEIAKQKFTDMLVHDLRRRVSSVLMSFSLLEKKMGQADGKARELTTTMRISAERMLIQINNLLDIRKIEEDKMTLRCSEISLGTLLRDSLEEYRPAADLLGVKVRLVEGDPLTVRVDPNIFERVLANLFWNALQHAPGGTEIEVGYDRRQGRGAALYVANRGNPIPREEQDRLFHTFVSGRGDLLTGNIPGTGLGLAFCKLAMEAHGGRVDLESPWSAHGDGANVAITLPSDRVMQA